MTRVVGRVMEEQVTVVGGSAAGFMTAGLLARGGKNVTVFERTDRPDPWKRTLIVTYDGSDEGQALAEQARRLLRVGRIQISAQQQGIVDLTIVVGEDFLTTL